MTFPSSWVDALFAKLTLRYGVAFMRQYQDLDIALVKGDWAEVLDGFDRHPEAIKCALENLPSDKPPTVLQFRDAARKSPAPELPKLPEPAADPQRVVDAIAKLRMVRDAISMRRNAS